jgi:acyl carrier protein
MDEIKAAVIAALKEVQQLSGRGWNDLADDMKPIGTLEGFDSLSGIEATIAIEQRLGQQLDTETLFEDGRRAFTLAEICDRAAKHSASQEVA